MLWWGKKSPIRPPEKTVASTQARFKMPETAEQWLATLPPQTKSATHNGTCYMRDESGKWIADKQSQDRLDENDRILNVEEARKGELYWALRTRLLTDEEMAEVMRHGNDLLVQRFWRGSCSQSGYSINTVENERRLNEALLQQYRFRLLAAQIKKESESA
jgi:hypothetical protein